MDFILEDTTTCITQGIELLEKLTPEFYTQKQVICYGSTIGGHVRHNLDHFFCFLLGIPEGKINYDARDREEFIETDPEYAAQKMKEIIVQLEALKDLNLEQIIEVKMDSCANHEESETWSPSSIRREIQFLISHTVHHYALIATLCTNEGYQLPEEFGVAPSTLRFRKSRNEQCAQ